MSLKSIADKTADPRIALVRLEEAIRLHPPIIDDPALSEMLAHLFAGSEFLSNWLLSRSDELAWLCGGDLLKTARPPGAMSATLAQLVENNNIMAALRKFKHKELCRLAARELSGAASNEETFKEWSTVADLAIDMAINKAYDEALAIHGKPEYEEFEGSEKKIARICVLALGKLGGEELNISSDIDIIFVHSSDNGVTTGLEDGGGVTHLHQFFVGVARKTVKTLSEVTEEGYVFRVDLDLRPEGTKGEITNSIGAMETYYESWGQHWERQALIKARYCGGSSGVGLETLGRLHPFIYRKYLDQSALDEIAAIKAKIDLHLKTKKGLKRAKRDIKLGVGGIREIEFIAQALQLLHGARYKELQTRSTIQTLDRCLRLEFLSRPHHRDLKEAYIFYRRMENRLQYQNGAQTHLAPTDREKLDILAYQMGIYGEGRGRELEEEVARKRTRVRNIFDIFFSRKEEAPAQRFPAPLDDLEASADWLDSLGFNRPKKSAESLNTLRNGRSFTHPTEGSKAAFDRFGPYIVSTAASASWPDNVILGFEEFVNVKSGRDMLYGMFDKHRPVIKLLAAIFSSSERLTSILLRQPDILDRLVVANAVGRPADRASYIAEIKEASALSHDIKGKIARLNSFRSAELLRLGLRKILDLSDQFELMKGLTILSEEYLKAVIGLSCEAVKKDMGIESEIKWTILAAGKLGRREMNFGSDADMLVFYEGEAPAKEYVTRLTQSIIRLSGMMTPFGMGYPVDMRLRPDGEKGPLAPSFRSMRDYYQKRGQAWERLALVGARPIAGDEEFSAKVMETIDTFIYIPPPGPKEMSAVARIRERIADEKVKPGAVDIKFGRGGLIEIEFICQWLKMEKTGGDHPDRVVAGPFTYNMLNLAAKKGWISSDVSKRLVKGYLLYRSCEDVLRMNREQAVNIIPKSGLDLSRTAKRVNVPGVGPDNFIDFVKGAMKDIREVFIEFVKIKMDITA